MHVAGGASSAHTPWSTHCVVLIQMCATFCTRSEKSFYTPCSLAGIELGMTEVGVSSAALALP